MASKSMAKKAVAIEKRLAALEGPEWDSDDESGAPAAGSAPETLALPPAEGSEKKALGKKARKKAAAAAREKRGDKPRVVYIGHVPHGFYEEQMRGFFSQFGELTNLRLSRSKKTGGSKGYAFVEFGDAETARVAAATMDKYLMHGKQLVAHVVPAAVAAHPKLFANADKKFLKRIGGKAELDAKHKRTKTPAQCDAAANALLKAEEKKRKRLAADFPDFDFPGYAAADERRLASSAAADEAAAPPSKKKAKRKKSA